MIYKIYRFRNRYGNYIVRYDLPYDPSRAVPCNTSWMMIVLS
jgi:hypothetical protein